ncbi:MAG: hypothetical protein DHS20C09_18330 [marine bacterium B5-7]|nr:MAG: hypothetical protein DHS20C09_18330 [marine bacterium B5-7]
MGKIFFSYSHENREFLTRIRKQFDAYATEFAIDFFDDSEIPAGIDWEIEIETQLRESDCLVALITPDWRTSKFCQYEFSRASSLGKRLYPFLCIDTSIPEAIKKLVLRPVDDKGSFCPLQIFPEGKQESKLKIFAQEVANDLRERVKSSSGPPDLLARRYMKSENFDQRKAVLRELVLKFLAIRESQTEKEAKFFAGEFYKDIPQQFHSLLDPVFNLDIFKHTKDLLLKGLPNPTHLIGLNRVNGEELANNPAYLIMILAMKDMEKGYKNPLKLLREIENSELVESCALYQCLLTQCHRKLGDDERAKARAEEAIAELKRWLPNRSACKCAFCRSKEGPILLEMEFYRCLGAVYRSKAVSARDKISREQFSDLAKSYLEMAVNQFETAVNYFKAEDPVMEDLLKKGADIYFSLGYFLFENFFAQTTPTRNEKENVNEIITVLGKSEKLNPKHSAPTSRLAIMHIYKGSFEKAFDVFEKVQRGLSIGGRSLNIEELFLEVWCAIGQHQLVDAGLADRKINYLDTINKVVYKAKDIIQKDDLPSRPLRCHTFDLQILDRTFQRCNKPIIDDDMRSIINEWTSKVLKLDSSKKSIPKTAIERSKGALLIGFGEMGEKFHFPSLKEMNEPIVGVIRNRNIEIEGVDAYSPSNISAALAKHKPALAIVATPHTYHFNQIKECLEAGCHVLCEKPLALRVEECEELVELAKKLDRLLVVNLQRRYEAAANIFRKLQTENKLGEIKIAFGIFYHCFDKRVMDMGGWRLDPAQAGAGILEDSAYHLVDLLSYFSGSSIQLGSLVGNSQCNAQQVPQVFSYSYKTKTDCLVTATGGYTFPENAVQEEISIVGTRGSLFITRFRPKWNSLPPDILYISSDGNEHTEFPIRGMHHGRALPLKQLIRVMRDEADPTSLYSLAEFTIEAHKIINELKKI